MDSNLTVADAAKILGVSAPRVYQFANEGKIGHKVNGNWVFSESEVREFAAKPRKNGRPEGRPENELSESEVREISARIRENRRPREKSINPR